MLTVLLFSVVLNLPAYLDTCELILLVSIWVLYESMQYPLVHVLSSTWNLSTQKLASVLVRG